MLCRALLLALSILLATAQRPDHPDAATEQAKLQEYHSDFAEFDINRDGVVDGQELRQAFEGDSLGVNEVSEFFLEVDRDHTGTIDFNEYVRFLKSHKQ